MSKLSRASKAIAKLQDKYDIKINEDEKGTVTFGTWALIYPSYNMNDITTSYISAITKYGEEELRILIYEKVILKNKLMRISNIVVFIIIILGFISLFI